MAGFVLVVDAQRSPSGVLLVDGAAGRDLLGGAVGRWWGGLVLRSRVFAQKKLPHPPADSGRRQTPPAHSELFWVLKSPPPHRPAKKDS